MSVNLEIGGGHLVREGWWNIDPVHGSSPEFKRFAQETPWPLADESILRIRASHVMEHIPAGRDRIAVMNEAHRVLAKKGTLEIIVPLLVGTWHAVADPTHVSFWVKESFHYFDGLFAANADYGIKLWRTISLEVVDGWEGHWVATPLK